MQLNTMTTSTSAKTSLAGLGTTVHPKLSMSAKRSVGAMPMSNNATPSVGTSSFQLTIGINNAETNDKISFKQDGNRFETSQRTLKLYSNCKYKLVFRCKPQADFHNLHIGGSDVELVNEHLNPTASEYVAIWNTTGIDPTKKGSREDILLILTGPGKFLRKKLQAKFYMRNDNHADYGHKVESIIWRCEVAPGGEVKVTDEQIQ